MIATAAARGVTTGGAVPAGPARRPGGAVLLRRLLLPLLVIALLIAAWDVAIRVLAIPAYVIPAPAAVGQALVKERARLLENAVPTILESLGGLAPGHPVSIPPPIAFVPNNTLPRAPYPVAVAVRTPPLSALP